MISHAYTRRGALSAIAMTSAAVAAATSPAAAVALPNPDRAAWDLAMRQHLALKSEYEGAWAAWKATPPANRADGTYMDDLSDAYSEAQNKLMRLPAPDLTALRWKLESILEDDGSGSTAGFSSEYVAPIFADVRRLEGAAA